MIVHGEIVTRVVAATRAAQSYTADADARQGYRDALVASLLGHARRVLRDPQAALVRAAIGTTHAGVQVVSRDRHMTVTIHLATGEATTEEIAR